MTSHSYADAGCMQIGNPFFVGETWIVEHWGKKNNRATPKKKRVQGTGYGNRLKKKGVSGEFPAVKVL